MSSESAVCLVDARRIARLDEFDDCVQAGRESIIMVKEAIADHYLDELLQKILGDDW